MKSTKKFLALALALMMLISLVPMSAVAAGTAPTNIAVYFCNSATSYSVHEVGTLAVGATVKDAALAANPNFNINDTVGGVWMYTVNGQVGTEAANECVLNSYDFVAFYKVPDYTTTYIVSPNKYSTMIDPSYTGSGRWCGLYLTSPSATNGMLMSLDYSKSYEELSMVTSTTIAGTYTQAQAYMVLTATAPAGKTYLPGCIPMMAAPQNIYLPRVANMRAKALAFANAIPTEQLTNDSSTALSDAISTLQTNSSLAVILPNINALMNTIAGLTYTTDTRLQYVGFSDSLMVTPAFFGYNYTHTENETTVTVPYTVINSAGDPESVPAEFAINFTPVAAAATVTVTSADSGVTLEDLNDNSWKVSMTSAVVAQEDPITLTATVNNGAYSSSYTLTVKPTYFAENVGASIYAFLPAPGQFTNEGVTTGGWGDAYTASAELKNNESIGVSLGYFGGYVVYEFDQPVQNSATNPYGADFIVYGNAFFNNSEPGCIQVSQDGNTWYDIAGSMHYDAGTVWNASITYTNPDIAEDASITAPGSNLGTMAPVNYSLNGGSTQQITTNNYHSHSWWPLNANYFVGRYNNTELAKVSSLPFVSQTTSSGVASTLTFTGTLLGGFAGTSGTPNYGFGYCDVHPNGTLGGTVAYNPYVFPSATINTANTYNTFLATAGAGGTQASGGDPIDISWAVNSNGEPVNLTSIKYVRIYTGTAIMNGIFGEISTEVCGIAACTGTGSGAATSDLYVEVNEDTAIDAEYSSTNMNTVTVNVSGQTASVDIYSGEDHVFVNGQAVSCTYDTAHNIPVSLAIGETANYQIITQNGTESPYITLLKVVRTA